MDLKEGNFTNFVSDFVSFLESNPHLGQERQVFTINFNFIDIHQL